MLKEGVLRDLKPRKRPGAAAVVVFASLVADFGAGVVRHLEILVVTAAAVDGVLERSGAVFTEPAAFGAFVPGLRLKVAPTAAGPLNGLTFAVKDLIDVAGTPTGGGP